MREFSPLAQPLKIYIGWDPREQDAYDVAEKTLRRYTTRQLMITPLVLSRLELAGLVRRPLRRLQKGKGMIIRDGRVERRVITAARSMQLWDEISDAPMSTEFANSRFVVPLLAQSGWAAFLDPDIVVRTDIAELFSLADSRYALMCVQHPEQVPSTLNAVKMDSQLQVPYRRKNWSSVMLFNCDHPKNRGLTLDLINSKPGRDLHRFCWLDDADIGYLPPEWNWLVNVQPLAGEPKIAHFTLGGPWIENWQRQPYDDIWLGASQDC